MKTTWVLTDEERKHKFDGRRKRKSGSDSAGEEKVDEASTAGKKTVLSKDEMLSVEGYVRCSDYWEQSKVNDMDTGLLRQIIRMVAFRARMTSSGQEQLQTLMLDRTTGFVTSLAEFQELHSQDQKELLVNNLTILMRMKTCSFFSPSLNWKQQLSPLLGPDEVEKLDSKLRSLNMTGF